jgi:hypothetical protein
MRLLLCVLLLALEARAALSRESGWQWHETLTPHFTIIHEMPWTRAGFTMRLEKLHGQLRMDLGMFSTWMAQERIKLYLYKNIDSYLAGEFRPPSWSNGLALFHLKAVAAADNPDADSLMRVIGHETTHMLFRIFWNQSPGRQPPAWLNEGLAMLEESGTAARPEFSAWYQMMATANPNYFFPIEKFLVLSPAEHLKDKESVEAWYVQAYSLVYFLFRQHQRLQFKNFCSLLREGKTVDEALWLAYRYRGKSFLEKEWRRWLRRPEHRIRAQAAMALRPEPSVAPDKGKNRLQPMRTFKSLRD